MDGDAVFGDDFGAVKAVGDVLAGLQDGLGDDVGGLAEAPALEVGSKFDALVVAHLMTHDAADGEGGTVLGVAFELQHVFELDGAGDGGRCLDGDELDGVWVKDALLFKLSGDAVGGPVVGAAIDEPPHAVAMDGGFFVFGDGKHGLGGAGVWGEGEGVEDELAFLHAKLLAGGAGF